jgi:hypothetical protein
LPGNLQFRQNGRYRQRKLHNFSFPEAHKTHPKAWIGMDSSSKCKRCSLDLEYGQLHLVVLQRQLRLSKFDFGVLQAEAHLLFVKY